jgi:hypothetical protein
VCVRDIVLFILHKQYRYRHAKKKKKKSWAKFLNLDLLLLVVLKCSTAVLNLSTTVLLAARKSRMLELLAFDKKSIFDFFFVGIKLASLRPPRIKQRPSSHTALKICKNWIRFFFCGWFWKSGPHGTFWKSGPHGTFLAAKNTVVHTRYGINLQM